MIGTSKIQRAILAGSVAAILAAGKTANATVNTATLTVPGTAAIFLAGRTDVTIPANGATLPPGYPLVRTTGPATETFPSEVGATSGEIFQFSNVTGTVNPNYTNNSGIAGPDGNLQSENLNAVGGISGYSGDVAPLVGVFLSDTDPQNATAPATLNFSTAGSRAFTTLSPAIGQVFFIGDGLTGTGTGTEQTFVSPAGATRLFLGITDGPYYSGTPGTYDDNVGSFSVTATGTTVPEPASGSFLLCAGMALLKRRR